MRWKLKSATNRMPLYLIRKIVDGEVDGTNYEHFGQCRFLNKNIPNPRSENAVIPPRSIPFACRIVVPRGIFFSNDGCHRGHDHSRRRWVNCADIL